MERILKKTYRTASAAVDAAGGRDLYFCGLRIEMFLHVCFPHIVNEKQILLQSPERVSRLFLFCYYIFFTL